MNRNQESGIRKNISTAAPLDKAISAPGCRSYVGIAAPGGFTVGFGVQGLPGYSMIARVCYPRVTGVEITEVAQDSDLRGFT